MRWKFFGIVQNDEDPTCAYDVNYQKIMNWKAPKNQKGKKTEELMTVEPTRETNDIKTDADESNMC